MVCTCVFLVMDVNAEMLGSTSTMKEALAYKSSFNNLTSASPMAGLADYGRPSTPQILRSQFILASFSLVSGLS